MCVCFIMIFFCVFVFLEYEHPTRTIKFRVAKCTLTLCEAVPWLVRCRYYRVKEGVPTFFILLVFIFYFITKDTLL